MASTLRLGQVQGRQRRQVVVDLGDTADLVWHGLADAARDAFRVAAAAADVREIHLDGVDIQRRPFGVEQLHLDTGHEQHADDEVDRDRADARQWELVVRRIPLPELLFRGQDLAFGRGRLRIDGRGAHA